VHVDFVGPLSKIDGKWQYVFTVIDAFSRWVHLIPVRDETAQAAAEALMQRVITVHGCPLMIVSDQGASFISNLWTELGKMLNINMTRANARHPQTNGAAERIHRTLNAAIRATLSPEKPWKEMIPFIEWAYRTMPIDGLGLSPFQIIYGRDPVMPTELHFMKRDVPKNFPKPDEVADYVKRAKAQLQAAQEVVRQADVEQKSKAKERRDAKREHIDFEIGDRVIVFMPRSSKNIPQRRLTQWTGVCTIIEKIADNSYRVRRDDKNNTPLESYNVDRLIRVPKDTKLLEPDFDADDEMNGLLQMPADFKARKEAYEEKRTRRDEELALVAHPVNANDEKKAAIPKEQKLMTLANQPSMEVLAEDLALRSWKQLRVGDKALKFSVNRWLPVQVLKLMSKGRVKFQFMYPRRNATAANNAKADWAPLWRNIKREDQRSQWSLPSKFHEPLTATSKRRALKFVGLQLQSYTLTRRGRRRFRIHPVWWAMIKKDTDVFRSFAV